MKISTVLENLECSAVYYKLRFWMFAKKIYIHYLTEVEEVNIQIKFYSIKCSPQIQCFFGYFRHFTYLKPFVVVVVVVMIMLSKMVLI